MIIISGGGQIGVDQAALDAAIDQGCVDPGFMGCCPRGRRSKAGVIPERFKMHELSSDGYFERTLTNVLMAGATLVLYQKKPTGGTRMTIRLCEKHSKPCCQIDLNTFTVGSEKRVARWCKDLNLKVLNVAGPGREELREPAYRFVWYVLEAL